MKKIAVSVLGYDRPGIIAAVSRILLQNKCNIEDVSQTTLQTEFSGTFVASLPEERHEADLLSNLQEELVPMGFSVLVKTVEPQGEWIPPESEAFIITTVGPDRLGLVAGITALLAQFQVNITGLKAVFRGDPHPHHNVMIYEVDIPKKIDQNAFRSALQLRAKDLGLEVSIQHREIFEAIHRV